MALCQNQRPAQPDPGARCQPKLPEHPSCPSLLVLWHWPGGRSGGEVSPRPHSTSQAALLSCAAAIWLQELLSPLELGHVRQQRCCSCEPPRREHGDEAPNCHPPERCDGSTPNQCFQPEVFGLQVSNFLMNNSNFVQQADTFLWSKYSHKIQFSH